MSEKLTLQLFGDGTLRSFCPLIEDLLTLALTDAAQLSEIISGYVVITMYNQLTFDKEQQW